MTLEQVELFALFGGVLGLLLWGRVRHDLVAAGGLFAGVLIGVVPESQAFSGFSHPAVLIVALVLIASRAFENSGALGFITGRLLHGDRSLTAHVAVTGGVGAALSAVINNVAALAILMPIDVQAARKAGRPPGLTLMPLAFATILGGLITLIGTPPNIIASALREKHLGRPYQMFDFTPVGIAVALAGLAFVACAGWRLLARTRRHDVQPTRVEEFMADLVVPEGSPAVGKIAAELDAEAEKADILVIGLVRDGKRLAGGGRYSRIEAGDVIEVEGAVDGIAAFIKAWSLQEAEPERPAGGRAGEAEGKAKPARASGDADQPAIVEVVVRADSRIAGRSAAALRLRSRFGVTLLGISHHGRTYREEVRTRIIEAGDLLLVTGREATLAHAAGWLGLLPISQVSVAPVTPWRLAVVVGVFAAAIAVAAAGFLSFTVALAIAVAVYAAAGLVPARDFYSHIEWPVVVMLACLLPLGAAFDHVGGTALVADGILSIARGYPAAVALALFMVATMTLSDVLNNVATMVVAGPIGIELAQRLGANPDTFLMGAAVASSCAFLTPIGHKNNTLVMGPGGYAFRDYWPMGLPVEVVVLLVGLPMLLLVWPL